MINQNFDIENNSNKELDLDKEIKNLLDDLIEEVESNEEPIGIEEILNKEETIGIEETLNKEEPIGIEEVKSNEETIDNELSKEEIELDIEADKLADDMVFIDKREEIKSNQIKFYVT